MVYSGALNQSDAKNVLFLTVKNKIMFKDIEQSQGF